MSSSRRRFEVLLPLRFNDGREVPAEWTSEAVLEIVDRFGAVSHETEVNGGMPACIIATTWCGLSWTFRTFPTTGNG
jgi:hypothetical protein